MDTMDRQNNEVPPTPDDVPQVPNPLRQDAPESITSVPRPTFIGHIHIYTDENYEAMVDFYTRFTAGEVIAEQSEYKMTFIAFDEYDHRFAIIKKEGWGPKPERAIGYSHVAFGYQSLGEILYLYERMRDWGYSAHWVNNHGNCTSIYYRDPDGNEIETLVDNFAPIDTKSYKKNFQYSEAFGIMREADFDPEKMLALYQDGISDEILLNREEVKRLKAEGIL
jgi:catechol-2,3-dioxygenase